jgi:uncharacterized membrane protein (UPF0127 family)
MNKFITGFLILVFSALLGAAEPALQDLSTYPTSKITVRTASGPQQFDVWIADTPARQRQGLMFVRDLPASQGMLFVNEAPRVASFWMKNTFIPLDILFFDASGRLVAVFENTTPQSLDPIGPAEPVKWILELRGGESTKRGIRPGDRLTGQK